MTASSLTICAFPSSRVLTRSYAWVCVFDMEGEKPMIKTVRAYLDSALVRDVMDKNGHGVGSS